MDSKRYVLNAKKLAANTFLQLEQALQVSEKDVKDASAGVLQDLQRFQKDKEADLRRYMVCMAVTVPTFPHEHQCANPSSAIF